LFLFCATLAFFPWRFVRFATDQKATTTLGVDRRSIVQFAVTNDGRPIKIASIIVEHTRECLGETVERNITGEHLTVEMDRVVTQRGAYPIVRCCDNESELACGAMPDWGSGQVGLHFIPAR